MEHTPKIQVTKQDGRFNVTIRTDTPEEAVKLLVETWTKLEDQVAFQGEVSKVMAPSSSDETCDVCGSSMRPKTITSKKDGKQYNVLECTNLSCKNDKGYRTTKFLK